MASAVISRRNIQKTEETTATQLGTPKLFDEDDLNNIGKLVEICSENLTVVRDLLMTIKEGAPKKQTCLLAVDLIQKGLQKVLISKMAAPTPIEEIKRIVEQAIESKLPTEKNSPTYSAIATKTGTQSQLPATASMQHCLAFPKRKYKLLIYPKKGNNCIKSSEETKMRLTQGVNPKELGFQPERVTKISNNGILVESSDIDLEKMIDNEKICKLGLRAQLPRRVWPKVRIYDIPTHLEKDDVITAIESPLEKELELTSEWCVSAVKTGPKGKPNSNWIVELHPAMWRALVNSGRMSIGWLSSKVENFTRVTKCFKCQRFGHIAKYCKSEPSCGYCISDQYETKDYEKKNDETKHRCINCIRAKLRVINHSTNHPECPAACRKREEYINNINFEN
jgi:hypothetical protein